MIWNWLQSPFVLVAVGGALGSVGRYGVGRLASFCWPAAPSIVATTFVNLLGALILGCLVASLPATQRGNALVLLLGVGFCGGFTTFSTLAMEMTDLIAAKRWDIAALYGCGSLALGCVAFAAGVWLMQRNLTSQ